MPPTTDAPTGPPPRPWLRPGALVTPATGADAGTLFRVTALLPHARTGGVSVELADAATGAWGIAAPHDLDPADDPEEA